MSQRSQKKPLKPRQSNSQRPVRNSQIIDDSDDENCTRSSQSTTRNKSTTGAAAVTGTGGNSRHVSNAVKFILASDFSKVPIQKASIHKVLDCDTRLYKNIIDSAIKILKDTFGYEIVEMEGKLFLINKVKNDLLRYEEEFSNRYVLLFIALAHIYMSGDRCTQGSMLTFLMNLGIIDEGSVKSDVFGDVIDLITNKFVKEKYIQVDKPKHTDVEETELRWGIRSELEVSRRTVMEFVSQAYRGRAINTWPQQYQIMLQSEKRLRSNARDESILDDL